MNAASTRLTTFVFLRLLGLIFFCAFVSFGIQAAGLIGSHGILPLREMVDAVHAHTGIERVYLMPMLFWWNASDAAIQSVCWSGAGLSLLLTFDVLPRLSLALLYVLYLSLLYAGQDFTSYQWDTYLLETGFLALLASYSNRWGVWLLRWLLFRFMFMSGMVKLLSGDPNWWGLTALSYHFFTQPLPTPVAWYAAHLPGEVLRLATACMLLIELVFPFLIFGPRPLRLVAAFGFLLLQSVIFATGNYNWFNLQTMALCLLLFDDDALQKIAPPRLLKCLGARVHAPVPGAETRVLMPLAACLLVSCSLVQMAVRFGGNPPSLLQSLDGWIAPLHVVNPYGLFAVMTTARNEIIIEGSDDGLKWLPYEFRYKPGDLTRRPRWTLTHQPRLDWQLWFAALDDPDQLPWFGRFLERILENQHAVTGLLQRNPFPDKPPKFIRAQFYAYTFADPDQQAHGHWWNRQLLGAYFPAKDLL